MAFPPLEGLPAASGGVAAPPNSGQKKGILEWLSQRIAAGVSQVDRTITKVDNYFSDTPSPKRSSAESSQSKSSPRLQEAQRQAAINVESARSVAVSLRNESREQEAKVKECKARLQALEEQLEEATKQFDLVLEQSSEVSTSAGDSRDASSSHRHGENSGGIGEWKSQKMRQWDHRPLAQVSATRSEGLSDAGRLVGAGGWCGACTFAPPSRIEAIDPRSDAPRPAAPVCEPFSGAGEALPRPTGEPTPKSPLPRSAALPSVPVAVSALTR